MPSILSNRVGRPARGGRGDRLTDGPPETALSAMAKAVRRSRGAADPADSGSHLGGTPTTSSSSAQAPPPPPEPPRAPLEGGLSAAYIRDRRLKRSAEAVAILVAVLLVVLGAVALSAGGSHPSRSAGGSRSDASVRGDGAAKGDASRAATTTLPQSNDVEPGAPSASAAPPATAAPRAPSATPGGSPVISSVSPSQGAAGQSVTITGANFLSSDGEILVSFDGQPAPTSCPVQTTCTFTVPQLPSSTPPTATVPVTVTTASGTSNTEAFAYSG
ncbi:MAG: IPT/TIG domain-containing protein [Acidimicrobiales bacterium]